MIIWPIDRLRYNDRFPWANTALIFINSIIFLVFTFPKVLDPSTAESYEPIAREWGVVPADVHFLSLITYMYLHANWLHVVANLLFLWVFGGNVERRVGPFLYLLFYHLTGVTGAWLYVFFHQGSSIPLIGASGAIFGVMGMYAVFFTRWKIDFIYGIPFVWNGMLKVPCFFVMGLYIIEQVLNWIILKDNPVAVEAHMGGFIPGLLLALAMRKVGVRRSFILQSEIDPTDELLAKAGPQSTRLLRRMQSDTPVALIAKKHIRMTPEALPDGLYLTPEQSEDIQRQCRESLGLYYRKLDAAVARMFSDAVRRKYGAGMELIPVEEFVDLPPSMTVVDAWFGPEDIELVFNDGTSLKRPYSDMRLLAAGIVQPSSENSIRMMQLIASNPAHRYLLNERILRFDLARKNGVMDRFFDTLAAQALKSQKIGFVNKSVNEFSEGRDSGRTTFPTLGEFDVYTQWVLNVATLLASHSGETEPVIQPTS